MKFYTVLLREVHIQPVQILAESKQNAIELVKAGSGEFMNDLLEYSHTLDTETWTVEEAKKE